MLHRLRDAKDFLLELRYNGQAKSMLGGMRGVTWTNDFRQFGAWRVRVGQHHIGYYEPVDGSADAKADALRIAQRKRNALEADKILKKRPSAAQQKRSAM